MEGEGAAKRAGGQAEHGAAQARRAWLGRWSVARLHNSCAVQNLSVELKVLCRACYLTPGCCVPQAKGYTEGASDSLIGGIKKNVGSLFGNTETETKGRIQETKGNAGKAANS
jgi:uncharacterized protein YjbJ (UPF0337 family)